MSDSKKSILDHVKDWMVIMGIITIIAGGATWMRVQGAKQLDAEQRQFSTHEIKIEEFVILNGTTPVATVNNYLRVNNFHVMFANGITVSAGNIDIRQVATPANIMDRIGIGGNMSLQAFYTVPLGKTAYITDWSAGSDGTKAVRFILGATADFSDRSYLPNIFHFQDIIMSDGGPGVSAFPQPLKCPQKSSIKISGNALSTTSGGAASFGFILIDN